LWCLWRKDEDFPTIIPGDPEMDVDEDSSGDPATTGDTEDFLGDDESPNVSFTLSSVASTIDHESRRRITDFAIILETIANIDLCWVQDQWEDSLDVIMPIPGRDLFTEHVSGLVLSLIEVKPCPSHSLSEERRGELHQNRMVQAQNDILIQVSDFVSKIGSLSYKYCYRLPISLQVDVGLGKGTLFSLQQWGTVGAILLPCAPCLKHPPQKTIHIGSLRPQTKWLKQLLGVMRHDMALRNQFVLSSRW
jgi:hypothetical protein